MTGSRLVSLLGTAVLPVMFLMFFSCSRSELPTDEFIKDVVKNVEVDLSKIKTEPYEVTQADISLRKYRNDFTSLHTDIDSLLKAFPDPYELKAIKIQFLQNYPSESEEFVNSLYLSDSLNSHHQFFYGNSLEPSKSKEFFADMVRKKANDPYGYLGLALSFLYSGSRDLEIPGRLAYMSMIKDHTVRDSYEVLAYIFTQLGREDDLALLYGIMLVKDPSNSNAFDNLFGYYYSNGENEKGKDLLQAFIKNNPGSLSSASIAERYAYLGYLDEAGIYVAQARQNREGDSFLDYIDAKLKVNSGNIKDGLLLLEKYANTNISDRNLIYTLTDEIFAERLYTEKRYTDLLKTVEKGAPTIGDKVPELKGVLFDGSVFNHRVLAGKVYLIDFWAEWCAPCRSEVPNVVSVYEKYRSSGFEVIGINLDSEEDKEKAADYISSGKISWGNIFSGKAWDDDNVSKFRVVGIPATYLIDRNGLIRYKYIRGEKSLDDKVSALLSEK